MSETWAETDLQYRVGTSFLAEFAAGHTSADVLRELIQNEYDAGGTAVGVDFGETELHIRGNGKPVDSGGWTRLSVMVGTGLVAGTETAVAAKVNGIGSKNFGLRSLFLFGNRITIRSGGRQTVLDRELGALPKPVRDPTFDGSPGVSITVAYRETDEGDLRAFTPEREHDALAELDRILATSVVKLAQPTGAKRIERISIRSRRLGRSLDLKQSSKTLGRRLGAQARTVRIDRGGWPPEQQASSRYAEVEYSRILTPGGEFAGRNIPSYFRAPGGRIRIGVSFALDRRRLAKTPGFYYYPLGAVRAQTGAHFSVSAPFSMNEDRSQLLDTAASDWNRWLVKEAADFAVSLLCDTLFEQYGASAYAAVSVDPDHASSLALAEDVEAALTSAACWPSRKLTRGKPFYQPAHELTVPAPELHDITTLLRSERVINDAIAESPEASTLALECGSKRFDANSLVRFRCAGENASALQTKVTGASWSYTDFPEAWQDLNLQIRVGVALDRVRKHLTAANRADLRSSPTTLTRGGTLAAPELPLWVVDPEVQEAVPPATSLHPELASSQTLRSLCKPFETAQWAMAVAEAASDGDADETSLRALRGLLLTVPQLSRQAWKTLRQAPILLDHRGEPTAPEDLILRKTPGAALLEPVLRFAPADVARIRTLVEHLHIRSQVHGDDLVALAHAVEDGRAEAQVMRLALQRHSKLLTPRLAKRLHDIAFVETTTGDLIAPGTAYEKNARTTAALGSDHPWPLTDYGSLLSKLTCRTEPQVKDIIARLHTLKAENAPLPNPEAVYQLLQLAAKAERVRLSDFSEDEIVWTGTQWASPAECLYGADHQTTFGDALPILRRQRDAFVALGVPTRPTPAHWRRLFEFTAAYGPGRLPRRLRDALLAAYDRLDKLPDDIDADLPVLLDESGQLHSLDDARSGRFVIDDDPALSDAARRGDIPIAFAYPDSSASRFFAGTTVRRLSEVSRLVSVTPGTALSDVEPQSVPKLLARLADPDFASAAAALGDAVCGPASPRRSIHLSVRFKQIDAIDVVDEIERCHLIGAHRVVTHVDHFVDADRIVVTHARTQDELRRAFSRAIATIVDESDPPDRSLPDGMYFLSRCTTRKALARELEQRRIPWHLTPPDLDDPVSDSADNEDDPNDDHEVDAVGKALSGALLSGHAGVTPTSPASSPPFPSPPAPPPRRTLPDIDKVAASFSTSPSTATKRTPSGGGGGYATTFTPRTPQQAEEDQRLGQRGEEIAFRLEQQRVADRGQDPAEVIWVSQNAPAANHDIRSVDERGREIWIEVKATAGRSGRFSWPKAEFLLALSKRRRYLLHRVYEADTTSPTVIEIQDPFGRFESGSLILDLDTLAADAGSLGE